MDVKEAVQTAKQVRAASLSMLECETIVPEYQLERTARIRHLKD
jgi:hypothetical protein